MKKKMDLGPILPHHTFFANSARLYILVGLVDQKIYDSKDKGIL